ncbi:MAG: response regulator [Planctomycetes bacterium]|nr:response regulator [Planctomycetota bacterium]
MDNGRILIADDSITIATALRIWLTRQGHEVEVVADGLEAWTRVQSEQFDLIITDCQMPEMTGEELCERLQTLEGYVSIPVIILTGKATKLDVTKLRERLGVAEVFPKPFELADVAQAVEKCLAASEQA